MLPDHLRSPLDHHRCPTSGDSQVEDPQPHEDTLAGRSVLVKNLNPQTLQPRWTRPYLVICSTLTAVCLQDLPHWVHHSRIKLCPSGSQPNPSLPPGSHKYSPLLPLNSLIFLKNSNNPYEPNTSLYSIRSLHPYPTFCSTAL
uniref:Endogenous retroviral H protease/integrase-derived ORF1 mRNA n=1 Tax=Homo sapiens TaxID=9606 RepID=V9H0G2_HUMAN|nr:ORF derived from protease and integrase coding regions [Homo sapiens]